MSAAILRGDAACLPLADDSVDLILTSPPYWGQRDYQDGGQSLIGQCGKEDTPAEYIASLIACTREWVRVLKPAGSLFVNLGDKYANDAKWGGSSNSLQARSEPGSTAGYRRKVKTGYPPKTLLGLPQRYMIGCLDELGLILRANIVWSKTNGLPDKAKDRVGATHESLFHFTRRPHYFSNTDAIREAYADWTAKAYVYERKGYRRRVNRDRQDLGNYARTPKVNPSGRIPGSVWEITPQPLTLPEDLGVDHFAPMPMEMARRCILAWSPTRGIVLDPFGGVGTTALVAEAFGRKAISLDLSHDYGRAARWRTADPGERARAMQVPKPPPVADGQEALFGELTAGAS